MFATWNPRRKKTTNPLCHSERSDSAAEESSRRRILGAFNIIIYASVNIPSTHNDKKVTDIGAAAFNEHKDITSVTLPDTVTVIEGSAFDDCCSQAFYERKSIFCHFQSLPRALLRAAAITAAQSSTIKSTSLGVTIRSLSLGSAPASRIIVEA